MYMCQFQCTRQILWSKMLGKLMSWLHLYCPRKVYFEKGFKKVIKITSLAHSLWEQTFKIGMFLSQPCMNRDLGFSSKIGIVPPKSGWLDTLHAKKLSIIQYYSGGVNAVARCLPSSPEVPGSIAGLVEGWIFGWPSFPLKFAQFSILAGSVKWVPSYMDRFEAAARGA